jgi:hypothetical protein
MPIVIGFVTRVPRVIPVTPVSKISPASTPRQLTPAQSNRHAGAARSARESWRRSTATSAGPSIDPELMIRMALVGIRFERKLCEKVKLRGYRWFGRLEL